MCVLAIFSGPPGDSSRDERRAAGLLSFLNLKTTVGDSITKTAAPSALRGERDERVACVGGHVPSLGHALAGTSRAPLRHLSLLHAFSHSGFGTRVSRLCLMGDDKSRVLGIGWIASYPHTCCIV